MKKILIVCTGNSCRSQMAEGWLNYFTNNIKVFSAGTHPEPVNKYAIEAMRLSGIDISHHISNNINEYTNIDFDFVITVCDNAREKCPFLNVSGKRIHNSFNDPALSIGSYSDKMSVYITVRDEIRDYINNFIYLNL